MRGRETVNLQIRGTDTVKQPILFGMPPKPSHRDRRLKMPFQRTTQDKYIKNYDFDYPQTNATFTVTAVKGHVTEQDFPDSHRSWTSCDPFVLFDIPVQHKIKTDCRAIEKNIMAEARRSDVLMIWTDCDREGEHIGSEIVKIAQKAKRNITVQRARFSAIIPQCEMCLSR